MSIISILFSILFINSGEIRDRESGFPIPFATLAIVELNIGCVTDIDGRYRLKLDSIDINRQITISALGYESVTLPVSELLKTQIIYLEKKIFQLNQITVNPKMRCDYIKMGSKGSLDGESRGIPQPGYQWALLIKSPDSLNQYQIKEISYFLKSNSDFEMPFRVRLYEYDQVKQLPNNNLLEENLIVYPKKYFSITSIRGTWVSVNVDSLNIYIPPEGIVVGFEWITGEPTKSLRLGFSVNKHPNHKVFRRHFDSWILELNPIVSFEPLIKIKAERCQVVTID